MIKLPFLNKLKREKNVFDVFHRQKLKDISQPKKVNFNKNENSSDLLFVNTITKTNQYENLPFVQDDEIKKVLCCVNDKTKNEKVLDKINKESCIENIVNEKKIVKLNVSVDNKKVINDNNNDKYENLPLELLKEPIVNIKDTDKRKKGNNVKIKNNIFKKFKI